MTASTSTPEQVKNGVNVDALLGAREALEQGAGSRAVQMARQLRVGEWHAQPLHDRRLLRARRRAVARQDRSPSRRTIPRSSPPRTSAPTPVELVLVRPCELSHRGRCRCRPAARHPAPFGQGDARGRHGHPGHPRHRRRRAQRLRRHPRPLRHPSPTPAKTTSRRWLPNRRSGRPSSTSSPIRPTSSSTVN